MATEEQVSESRISEQTKRILENSLEALENLTEQGELNINEIHKIVQTTDTLAERHNVESRGFDKHLSPRQEEEELEKVATPLLEFRDGDYWNSI